MRRVVLFSFAPDEQRGEGVGGGAARLFFFSPCSADHERDWPPCKIVFFGLATNALNVKNNNNNNNCLNSAGSGPVNLRLFQTGAALAGQHALSNMRPSYPHPL